MGKGSGHMRLCGPADAAALEPSAVIAAYNGSVFPWDDAEAAFASQGCGQRANCQRLFVNGLAQLAPTLVEDSRVCVLEPNEAAKTPYPKPPYPPPYPPPMHITPAARQPHRMEMHLAARSSACSWSGQ